MLMYEKGENVCTISDKIELRKYWFFLSLLRTNIYLQNTFLYENILESHLVGALQFAGTGLALSATSAENILLQ